MVLRSSKQKRLQSVAIDTSIELLPGWGVLNRSRKSFVWVRPTTHSTRYAIPRKDHTTAGGAWHLFQRWCIYGARVPHITRIKWNPWTESPPLLLSVLHLFFFQAARRKLKALFRKRLSSFFPIQRTCHKLVPMEDLSIETKEYQTFLATLGTQSTGL